jgi:uncharacterized protein involved in exopolysaccharide biosynthesis
MDSVDRKQELDETERDISLIHLLAAVVRRWRAVALMVALAVGSALLVIIFDPQGFAARTVLVPSVDNSASRAQLLASRLPAGFSDLIAGTGSNEKLIGAVLRSRTLRDSVISRMGEVPYSRTPEEIRLRRILSRTRVRTTPEGAFVVQVRDSDAERSARLANLIPGAANQLLSEIVLHSADLKSAFLEGQVSLAQARLDESQKALVDFQQTQGAPEIGEQGRQTVEAAAELQKAVMDQEVLVAQYRRIATPDNPRLRAEEAELISLRGQLNRLTSGLPADEEFFLPLRGTPELRAGAARVIREYTRNEEIYLALTAALAEAQMDARNNLPVISVLDAAIVPLRPAGPSPVVQLAIAVLLGLFAGIVVALLREQLSVIGQKPENRTLVSAVQQLKRDVRSLLPGRGARPTTTP